MPRPPLAALVIATLVLAACTTTTSARRTFEFKGPTMGTTFSVKVVTGPEGLDDAAETAIDELVRGELEAIDAAMSTWRDDSELSRFNRSTSLDPFPLSDETYEVLRWAVDLGALTGGAMDVTVAPLVAAWGFGPDGRIVETPSDAELSVLRDRVGHEYLVLDPEARTVTKRIADVQCDLSALAAGYAADRIGDGLAGRGLADFLVDVGGELRARGRNDQGRAWQIAIELPQDGGRVADRIVAISDLAIATSGDYRNYYEVEGRRVTHIVDPRTGRPIQHALASVTVIDTLAVRADALSTALMVMGPEEGPAFALEHDLAAAFIIRDGDGFSRQTTPRLEAIAAVPDEGAPIEP